MQREVDAAQHAAVARGPRRGRAPRAPRAHPRPSLAAQREQEVGRADERGDASRAAARCVRPSVRAARSATTTSTAPARNEAGSRRRPSGPTSGAQRVRRHQADERDGARDGGDGAGHERAQAEDEDARARGRAGSRAAASSSPSESTSSGRREQEERRDAREDEGGGERERARSRGPRGLRRARTAPCARGTPPSPRAARRWRRPPSALTAMPVSSRPRERRPSAGVGERVDERAARRARPRTRRAAGRGSAAGPSRGARRARRRARPRVRRRGGPASASGLRKSDCSAAPTTASPPPTSAASSTRGRRTDHRIDLARLGEGRGRARGRAARSSERTTPPTGEAARCPRLSAASTARASATRQRGEDEAAVALAHGEAPRRRRLGTRVGVEARGEPPARVRGVVGERHQQLGSASRRSRPSRTARVRERSGCRRSASAAPGPAVDQDHVRVGDERALAGERHDAGEAQLAPDVHAARGLDHRADRRARAGGVRVCPVEDARPRRARRAGGASSASTASKRATRRAAASRLADRAAEVEDGRADPGRAIARPFMRW